MICSCGIKEGYIDNMSMTLSIMKHKAFILIICCLFVITLASGIVYASSPEQQVAAVAEELFNKEGKGTCVEVWNTIGFDSSEEANGAYLGDPIQVFVLENSVSVNKLLIDQEIELLYVFNK